MGNLLDELKTEMDAHPEWEEAHKQTVAAMEKQDLMETFSGKVFAVLGEKGAREGVPVRFEEKAYGRKFFSYGDETAFLQTHIEPSGLARSYTSMLDLQKAWWREAFLEHGEGGHLENVGLIAPSVLECLGTYFHDDAQKFRIDNILKAISQNPRDITDEYVENDLYGSHDEGFGMPLMKKLQDFWRPLVGPDFDIAFTNGGGDLWRKLRLVPLTQKGRDELLSGGAALQQTLQNIVDRYDDLISFLKQT